MPHGVFPNKLKTVIIKPLFKKYDKEDINNYRPIVFITTLIKIFEKTLYERLQIMTLKKKIFAEEEMGFRKKKRM